jgi:hypothetical protein
VVAYAIYEFLTGAIESEQSSTSNLATNKGALAMHHHRTPALRLLVALLLLLLSLATTPAEAAQPGEELANSSGALSAAQTFTTPPV